MEIRGVIEDKKELIVSSVKAESINKGYFQGLALPPEQFLDMIITDYLETIIICHEVGKINVFSEKIKWFKEMYNSRHAVNISLVDVMDFFNTIKNHLIDSCPEIQAPLKELFTNMDQEIKRIFEDGKKV